jgi:hypothetical protein
MNALFINHELDLKTTEHRRQRPAFLYLVSPVADSSAVTLTAEPSASSFKFTPIGNVMF